jgi:chorismate-pyruvate lyase
MRDESESQETLSAEIAIMRRLDSSFATTYYARDFSPSGEISLVNSESRAEIRNFKRFTARASAFFDSGPPMLVIQNELSHVR